ncbi:hypothetical protein B7R21_09820 [Subtercola boreus]|uniref:Uncharacterized protein n=1 Tax=Subtercola boreus TaxID=120213 RepID=A0A3E0VRK6_9MICO|nr:hypothetical protein [Subtercola boreus]RFA12634.1 hypothetical protein B7R21_09820 [Subtercola boreus]
MEKVVFDASSRLGKVPAAGANSDDQHLRFRFDEVDEHHWQLHNITKTDHIRLIKRLKHFEKLTLQQARATKVLGDYDMADCPNKNATAVLENQYDGQDSLAKLVIEPSGSLRLFGIRRGHEIHIVWWDPNHEVWPEGKTRR